MASLTKNPPINPVPLVTKRWLISAAVVFSIYNPSGHSYYHWVTDGSASLPLRLAVVAMPGVGRWLVTKMQAIPPERRAETSISELYVDPNRIQPERRAEAIAEMIRRDGLGYSVDALLFSARSLLTEYTRPGPASLWADAAKVTAPTLLIHGSHDRLVNPGMAGRAARTFPNCRVIVLPRIGHVAMMERPEEVAAEMRDFLRRTRAAAMATQDWAALGAVGS